MDLIKAKVYLDKINRDFTRMTKDPDTIVRIDVDIMLDHIRQLYDAFLVEKPFKQDISVPRKPAAARPVETPAEPEQPTSTPPPVPAPPPPAREPEKPAAPQPVLEEKPAPAPPPPAPDPPQPAEPAKPVEPVKPAPPEAPAAPSFSGVPVEAEALFEFKEAKELSEKLSDMPIADLRKAIALNDRLLLTRELFGGDASAFEAAISALNGFSGMDQAKFYLLEHCVLRFGWTDKKRLDAAKNFIKLVRRRYK